LQRLAPTTKRTFGAPRSSRTAHDGSQVDEGKAELSRAVTRQQVVEKLPEGWIVARPGFRGFQLECAPEDTDDVRIQQRTTLTAGNDQHGVRDVLADSG
jgi:hypothetical protein